MSNINEKFISYLNDPKFVNAYKRSVFQKFKHVTLLIYKNEVFFGNNMYRENYRGIKDCYTSIHAEVDVIKRFLRAKGYDISVDINTPVPSKIKRLLNKVIMINFRFTLEFDIYGFPDVITSSNISLCSSMPCQRCDLIIKNFNIGKLYYSNGDNTFTYHSKNDISNNKSSFYMNYKYHGKKIINNKNC